MHAIRGRCPKSPGLAHSGRRVRGSDTTPCRATSDNGISHFPTRPSLSRGHARPASRTARCAFAQRARWSETEIFPLCPGFCPSYACHDFAAVVPRNLKQSMRTGLADDRASSPFWSRFPALRRSLGGRAPGHRQASPTTRSAAAISVCRRRTSSPIGGPRKRRRSSPNQISAETTSTPIVTVSAWSLGGCTPI